MAEIAIPLLALGGLYIASNKDKKDKKDIKTKNPLEGFQNNTMQYSYPSMTAQPVQNYPTLQQVNNSNVNIYSNPNQVTDKYFHEKTYENIGASRGAQQNYSMTGNPIDKTEFKHNNMVPYFGAKIRGATVDAAVSESVLDNLQGQGSQYVRKAEMAPLFQPHQNLQYAHGAPNMSDFMQSRVNPGMNMANVKPWEEIHVAPALNQGYGTSGSLGFNSGMEARDLWRDKTVDELRVDTNPKMTFGLQGHQGPASSQIKAQMAPGMYPRVEKNLPDSYHFLGPERNFTTTGIEKAPTIRSEEMLNDVNRTSTTAEYYGVMSDREASYAKGEYQDTRRNVLAPEPVKAPHASGMNVPTDGDYGSKSYSNLHNNRSTTKAAREFGGISGIVKAIALPIFDILRPSRKENVVGNGRPTGNAGSIVPTGTIYNPADRTKTTIREMTEANLDCNHLNVEKQQGNAYLVTKYQPVDVQRDTTNKAYAGNAMPGTHPAAMSYDADYMQHNNVNKTYASRPNPGGTQVFSQKDNITIQRRDTDRDNNRMWVPSSNFNSTIPSKDTHGKLGSSSYYNETAKSLERMQPDILNAFKSNPYTQSLQSWA
jgi:hypothetical protein